MSGKGRIMARFTMLSAALFLAWSVGPPSVQGGQAVGNAESGKQSASQVPNGTTVPHSWTNPNLYDLNIRLRRWVLRIEQERRTGRLSAEQAQASMEIVRDIRRLENQYYFQNGRKDLTTGQKAELLGRMEGAGAP
jgi:hypothetical protein